MAAVANSNVSKPSEAGAQSPPHEPGSTTSNAETSALKDEEQSPRRSSLSQLDSQLDSKPALEPVQMDRRASSSSKGNHQLEVNPFDAQFSTSDGPTPQPGPGTKAPLPGFPTLASPGAGSSNGWRQSGPLSPAVMTGGSTSGDYFTDHHFRGGIPTPKESSLRSGLTPANASGSFDFPPTGKTAGAGNGSNPSESKEGDRSTADGFRHNKSSSNHDANVAANGLYMLAQSNSSRSMQQASRPQVSSPLVASNYYRAEQDESQAAADAAARLGDNNMFPEISSEPAAKPAGRARGKKSEGSTPRRGDDSPNRRQKRQKTGEQTDLSMDMSFTDDYSATESPKGRSGKSSAKMTDEEKRRNFLERNRIAALKCRQRKKQWLNDLQGQCSKLQSDNDNLIHQMQLARSEITFLKNIIFMHREAIGPHQHIGGPNTDPVTLSHILETGLVPFSPLTGQPKEPEGHQGAYPYVSTVSQHGHVIGTDGLSVTPMSATSYSDTFSSYHHSPSTATPVSVVSSQTPQRAAAQAQAQARAAQAHAQSQQQQQQQQSAQAPQPTAQMSLGSAADRGSLSFGSPLGRPLSQIAAAATAAAGAAGANTAGATGSGAGGLPAMAGLSAAIGASSGSEMPRPAASMMVPGSPTLASAQANQASLE